MAIKHELLVFNTLACQMGRVLLVGRIQESEAHPTRSIRTVSHPTLIFIESGDCVLRTGKRAITKVSAGEAILIQPGASFSLGVGAEGVWSESYVIFEGKVFESVLPKELIRTFPTTPRTAQIMADIESATSPSGQVSGVIAILSDLFTAEEAVNTSWIDRAKLLLTDRSAVGRPLGEIAADLDMSEQMFRKRFANAVGVPPVRYRTKARLEAAQVMLSCTRLTNREIAAALGFSDEFHFSKAFTQSFGQNPSVYRRSLTASE